jgi:phenylalanyl-tRNA synthetase alpha chain
VPVWSFDSSHRLGQIIRCEAGDIVERVEKFDEFVHPKTGRKSQAFRISYRDMSRNLTNAEVDEIQWRVRESLVRNLGVELR